MIGSKFLKALVLVIGIAFFSSSLVLVNAGELQSDVIQEQDSAIENDLLKKQKEIDQYVFEDHAGDIASKGFTVTHTGPMDTYVEIGITPYNEDNAEFLYSIFGREKVKVVEGQQAITLGLEAGNGNMESNMEKVYAVSDVPLGAKEVSETGLPIWIVITCAVGVILLVGAVFVTRRHKFASK